MDYVGADDGVLRPKPEADMFLEFQKKFGLKPREIAVVGDTYNDIRFGKRKRGSCHWCFKRSESGSRFLRGSRLYIKFCGRTSAIIGTDIDIKEALLWLRFS